MTRFDTIIRDCRIVSESKLLKADIGISNGKIAKIARSMRSDGAKIIEASDSLVIPGCIDGHAHIYDKKFAYREDFFSGTQAAAAGGITTVINMVLTTPVDTPERLKESIRVGERDAVADFALHAGMMNLDNLKHIPALAKMGAASFKTFTCAPYQADDYAILRIMAETKKSGSLTNIHAENEGLLGFMRERLAKRKYVKVHCDSRPPEAEGEAAHRVITFSRFLNARLHLSHISTLDAVNCIAYAKSTVTAETCPHYLVFTRDNMSKMLKMNPPLRSRIDREELWFALFSGILDIITSEHAPGTLEEKSGDIRKIWGGIPGVETMLPIVYTHGVKKRKMPMGKLVELMCANPAKIFGLYPRKGTIKVGSDADLVLLDYKTERKVKADRLHYKCGWSPYEGMKLSGWPKMTIVRGQVVTEDGELVAKRGFGEFVPRQSRAK